MESQPEIASQVVEQQAQRPDLIQEMKANVAAPVPGPSAAPAAPTTETATGKTLTATPAENGQAAAGEQPAASDAKLLTPLVKEQLKHCSFILRGMKRHAMGGPFLYPVDPVALGIPDYFSVIQAPMDLSTIQRKMDGHVYESAEQFQADVKLMLSNCYTYNKPETQVYGMAKALEKYFDGHWAKLPTQVSHAVPTGDDFGGAKQRKKSDASPTGRTRRESSATPHRVSTVIPAAPGSRAKRASPEITFCTNTWKELTKKSNLNLSWPFLEPVDPVKLGIPDYFTIIKTPMDLSTIKKKLDAGTYNTAEEFEEDVRQMFQNCYTYNGAESDVARLGRELEDIFDKKWAAKPVPGASAAAGYVEYDADSERITYLRQQITVLEKELNELLAKKQRTGSLPRAPPPKKAKSMAVPAPQLPDTMSFDEKRQLSNDVNNLSPEKLGRVVEIIHNSMPNLQQQSDSDVIELDIESLDIYTLRQLQKYVNECKGLAVKKRKPSAAPAGAPRPKKPMATAAGGMQSLPAPILEETLSSDDSSSSDDE